MFPAILQVYKECVVQLRCSELELCTLPCVMAVHLFQYINQGDPAFKTRNSNRNYSIKAEKRKALHRSISRIKHRPTYPNGRLEL